MREGVLDLVVIGGGINGAGIAADAAGRGLQVLLAEQADLGGATSSASSKLIHGGLRYLEHYEFRLVREALQEREVLLANAPHLIQPLRFVIPHDGSQRPAWLIRSGLFLYDHLARRKHIPASTGVDLRRDRMGRALRPELTRGFTYWDGWVDDARLVVLVARMAADKGALIASRTRVVSARAEAGIWHVSLSSATGYRVVRARALVNAAGPWSDRVAGSIRRDAAMAPPRPRLRLVKGSHIVVPRIEGADDAMLLQSGDGRVVFALPFAERFTLIGTTDVPYAGDPAAAAITDAERDYLLELANRFLRRPLAAADIAWTFAGVRPLYDDASGDPSKVTRDYRLDLDVHGPPLLTVLGGKITTYRRLAEHALDRLAPFLPHMGRPWTAHSPLPGGDIGLSGFAPWLADLFQRRPGLPPELLTRLARRHGTLIEAVLGEARTVADLGDVIAGDVSEREVVHLKRFEWAATPEDVLWRRTKCALRLSATERSQAARRVEHWLAGA